MSPPQERELVLVVDDEAQIRSVIRRCLTRAGFEVMEAGSVQVAIALLEAHRVDLLMTDLKMPGGNGTALIEWAGAHRPAMPVLCVSAFTDDVHLTVPV